MEATLAATDGRSVIERAYSEVYPNLVRSLTGRLRDRESAEDIAAESFARLAREVAAGRPPEAPVAWLWRVAANLVSSAWRRRAVAERANGWLASSRADDRAVELVAARDDVARVSAALATLPRSMQVALLLAADGATGAEIAFRLGRSEAAARTHLCRARMRLRDAVEAATPTATIGTWTGSTTPRSTTHCATWRGSGTVTRSSASSAGATSPTRSRS